MSGRPASSAPNPSKTQEVLGQVEEVKGLMVNNIDIMLKNHERADSVLQKTDVMRENAKTFKKGATKLEREMWWRNVKLTLIIILIVVAVLLVIIVPIALKYAKK